MKPQAKKIAALIMLSCFAFWGGLPTAAFADNWFTKFTESTIKTEGSAWTDQQRGYYSGGGYSIRTNIDRSTLFNITAPRISSGCGGIDAFWGGFSFLNPEYLIQKLKNILQAAPAYAFDLALNQLCQTCASIMKSLESIADTLNQLAIDDCQATRALVNAGAAGLGFLMGDSDAKTAQGDTDGSGSGWIKKGTDWVDTGLQDFAKNFNNLLNYRYGCDKLGSEANQEACRKKYTLEGSLWEIAVARHKERYPNNPIGDEFIKLARAIYGDINFTLPAESEGTAGKGGKINSIVPCDKSVIELIEAMTQLPGVTTTPEEAIKNAMIPTSEVNGECKTVKFIELLPEADVGKMLFGVQAIKILNNMKKAMKTPNATLDDADIAFINQSVVPVYTILNTISLTTGMAQEENAELSPLEEKAASLMAVSHALYVFNSLNDNGLYMMQYIFDNLKEYNMGIYEMNYATVSDYQSRYISKHRYIADTLYGYFQSAQTEFAQNVAQIGRIYTINRIYKEMLVESMY